MEKRQWRLFKHNVKRTLVRTFNWDPDEARIFAQTYKYELRVLFDQEYRTMAAAAAMDEKRKQIDNVKKAVRVVRSEVATDVEQ